MREFFSLECKERKKLPVFIWDCMAQADRNAQRNGNRPGVVLHELGKDHDEDIVMIRYSDFRKMLKEEEK